VTTQNGLDAPEIVAEALGHAKVLGGSCYVNDWVEEPGIIDLLGPPVPDKLIIAEAYTATGEAVNAANKQPMDRVNKLAAAFVDTKTEIVVADDGIWTHLWAKAGIVCCTGPVQSLVRAPLSTIATVPETRALLRGTMLEWATLRKAAGYHPGSETLEEVVDGLLEKIAGSPLGMTTSTARDIMGGKPSELHELTGSL